MRGPGERVTIGRTTNSKGIFDMQYLKLLLLKLPEIYKYVKRI